MDTNFLFVNALNGIIYGSFLLLTSLGLSLIFGLGRVVNFAHGALYALGGYFLLAVMPRIGGYWPALVIGPLMVVPVAVALERLTISPVRNRPDIYTLLVTFGVSFVIVGAIEYLWGTGTAVISAPSPFEGTLSVFGNQYPIYRLFAAGLSLVVSVVVFAIVQFTPIGLQIRAISDDASMAEALGIDTKWLLRIVFGGAAGLAAFAAALGAPIHPEMGMSILVDSFLAVILGGLGYLPGSAAGAFIVALTKSIGGGYIADWSIALLFVVVGVVLILRPTGVFKRGRIA